MQRANDNVVATDAAATGMDFYIARARRKHVRQRSPPTVPPTTGSAKTMKLDRSSVRTKLAIGGAAMIILISVVGAVSLARQSHDFDTVDRLLDVDHRIAELSMKSRAVLHDVRRSEKEMLLFGVRYGVGTTSSA